MTTSGPQILQGPSTPSSGLRLPVVPAELCPVNRPASRRFYIHERSFGQLMTAQPSFSHDLGQALLLAAASRGADQVVEDLILFSGTVPTGLEPAVQALHDQAAAALQLAFQCLIQLAPPKFGRTEVLLGQHERINAWCFEDGYFTYATDEDSAMVMYAETGSLRELRSNIRREPNFDKRLEMISGAALFLYDQRIGVGGGTARAYLQQHERLVRRQDTLPIDTTAMLTAVDVAVQKLLGPFDDAAGVPLIDVCRQRARATLAVVVRSDENLHPVSS